MKKIIFLVLLIVLLSSCSNKSAGGRMSGNGHGEGFFSGDVLKF